MLQSRVRISGPSWDGAPTCVAGPSPPLNPQAEHRVSPSVVCVQREAATCTGSGALLVGAGCCFHLALRGGVLFTPGMPRGDGMLGTEETKPGGGGGASRMPCCPPGSPHMRPQVSPGWSLKSLSRGSCLASRVQELLCHHPKPAPSHCPCWHRPGPTSSASCQSRPCPESPPLSPAAPGEAS